MDIDKLAKETILKNMTPDQQKAVLESVMASVQESKKVRTQKIAENVDLVMQALKKIEAQMLARVNKAADTVETVAKNVKDGKDGRDGKDGKAGKDGAIGLKGADGRNGKDGKDGKDGRDGVDGVSVVNAFLDFDNSLVIELSNGKQINVGGILADDAAEKVRVVANGGGTSQGVLDAIAALQTAIATLIPSQTGNSGKFLTTNGSVLSWASVAGGLSYQGTWNASSNGPTLASGTGTNGYYYVVATAGSTNLDGVTDWQIGDWLLFNGSTWQKIDQTNLVTSVAGRTGAITLSNSDVSGSAASGANSDITSLSGLTGAISNPTYIQMGSGSGTTLAAGRIWYDQTTGSINAGMGGGNITQQIGEELFIYGKASSSITEGQLVVKTGAVGASGVITFAPSPTGLTDNDGIIGVATENITSGSFGRITTFGVVHGITTTGASVGETWADGDVLYYNPSYAGGMTKVKPSAPYAKFQVGIVTHAGNGGSGSIQVDLIPGSVLGGTDSNVQTNGLSNGNLLTYNGSGSYWKNTALTAGTGISVSAASDGALTVANTSPMTYPSSGIPNSTGSAWGTSYSTSGTGTTLALTGNPTFASETNSGNYTFTGTSNRITGDFSNATTANRVLFQTSTTNGATRLGAFPNGTSQTAGYYLYNSSDVANASVGQIIQDSAAFYFQTTNTGSGTALPMYFATNGTERLRIDTSGNVGIGTSSPQTKLQSDGTSAGSLLNVLTLRNGSSVANSEVGIFFTPCDQTTNIRGAQITAINDGTNNIGLKFYTGAGASITSKMVIDSNGNVGIGTSLLHSKLTAVVVGTGGANNNTVGMSIGIDGAGTTQAVSGWRFTNGAFAGLYGGTYATQWVTDSANSASTEIVNTGATPIIFGTSATERMRIDPSGLRMLGTTTPSVVSGYISDTINGTSGSYTEWQQNGSNTFRVGSDSSDGGFLYTQSASAIRFGTNGNERMRINSSGNLLVGTTSAQAKLTAWAASGSAARFYNNFSGLSTATVVVDKQDNNTTTSNVFVQFTVNSQSAGSGQINANGASQAAFGSYSDERLKENIVDLEPQLDKVLALRPVEFDYKTGGHQTGFIAQEMQQVFPDAVGEDGSTDKYLTVTGWNKTEAILVKAIQELAQASKEQQAVIQTLTQRIETLEAK